LAFANDAQRPRILIAEDNELVAQEVGDFVRRCGYAVAGATPSVEGGLALIEHGGLEAAVLDTELAGEPSYPICRALSAKGVPFLFLSGRARRDAPIPPEFRAVPRLATPFEPSQLRSALQSLVGTAPAAADLPAFGNTVLDSADAAARGLLAASLEHVPLRRGERLELPGRPIEHVYFPIEGLVSLFAGSTPRTRLEVSTVGREGMTAPGLLLGDSTAAGEAVVQAAGSAWRIAAATLERLSEVDPGLRRHLLDHVGLALRQTMDAAAYSGRATVVERLARWLVQAAHRLGSRQLAITHDALAEILGVRRPSVSTGLQVLEGRRLIRATRRAITVLDLEGLAAVAKR
jgi:CRP-like cAMP-binding protein/CheY-like chemotaxis protein